MEQTRVALVLFAATCPGQTSAGATAAAAADAGLPGLPDRAWPCRHGLQLTPLRTGTDGFYVALLRRQD